MNAQIWGGDYSFKRSFSRKLHRHLNLFPYKSLVEENAQSYSILFIYNEDTKEQEIHKQTKSLVAKLKERNVFKVYAGLGRCFTKMEEIHVSLKDSHKCVEFLKQVSTHSDDLFIYQDLGVYRLLLNMDPQELESFASIHLEKILEYDRLHQSELSKTLEWYLEYNHSTRKTAEKMFLHENTIKYRINSIKKILGIEEITGQLGFELQLSLKIKSYLAKSHLSE